MNVAQTVKELNKLTVADLKECYAEVFGEATRCHHKQHLIRRIVWRMQALREGGVSERALRRAKELANEADLRFYAPRTKPTLVSKDDVVITSPFAITDSRLPTPGMLLRREYKGRVIQVRVLSKGFEFQGDVYRSLSAIAQKVTGSHWNGYLFFGLKQSTKEVG